MKIRKIIWAGVLLGCVGLGVWQWDSISIFWREYHSLWRDYEYDDSICYYAPRKPIIPKKIARTDPEAAAVADMILEYYERDEQLTAVAEHLLEFPDNEFLLFWCANRLLFSDELDQEAGVKLAEKLIELDGDNSLYHYLKAAALVADCQNNDINPALDEISKAANYTNFYFPYSKYRERAIAVAERASLRPKLISELSRPFPWAWWTRNIKKVLLRYAHRAFSDGDVEKGLLIDDAIESIGKNQFNAGHDEARVIMEGKIDYLTLRFGDWYSYCPEILELQRAEIAEERARQNRFQLCSYALSQIQEEAKKDKESYLAQELRVTVEMVIATPVAVHSLRMLFALSGVCLVLVAISMFRGWSGSQKVGIGALLLFAIALLCYFLIINWIFLSELDGCMCCYSHQYVMRMPPLDWDDIREFSVLLFLLLVCPVLVMLLVWVYSRPILCKQTFLWRAALKTLATVIFSAIASGLYFVIQHFAEEEMSFLELREIFALIFVLALAITIFMPRLYRFRFVKIILAVLPLGILTFLTGQYAYITKIPLILFVVTCGLIALNKPTGQISFVKVFRSIFGKEPASAAIRGRAIKLLATFIVIHWLILVASVPFLNSYIKHSYVVPLSKYFKLPSVPADEMSYQQSLAMCDSADFELTDFWNLAPLVMPEDLPAIMDKCKSMNFDSSHPYRVMSEPPKNDQDVEKLDDGFIIYAMQGCGRDVVGILTDYMDDPEQEYALVSRGQLGDVRVKAKLEQLLDSRIRDGQPPKPELNERRHHWDKPANEVDIIRSLACISEPNEAKERFLDCIARNDISQLSRDPEFFQSIALLPTTQATEIIMACLVRVQDCEPYEQRIYGLAGTVGTYADREISETVLKLMLNSENDDVIEFWCDSRAAPQAFDVQSAELLREGFVSDNKQLRAWCVWQLRKVGYVFSEEEMSRLLTDESWKVRANAVMAGGREAAERASNDANPFVRWVASLIVSE